MKLGFTKDNLFACCALCDSKILFKNPDQTINIDNYREVSFLTSINSVMTVGFCRECVDKAKGDASLFDSISESVKEGWRLEQEHENWKDEDRERYWKTFQDLKIINRYHGTNV